MGAGLIREITSDSEERVGCGTGGGFDIYKKSILNYLLSFTHFTSIVVCRCNLLSLLFCSIYKGLRKYYAVNFRKISYIHVTL